jgi:small-conductance mechanosensitive channel
MAIGFESPEEEVTDSVRNMAESVVEALPRIGVAIVLVLVGWALSRVLRLAVRSLLLRSSTPSVARVVSKVAGWLLLALAMFAALIIVFPSVKPVDLLAGLGIFSVAIGFAFQDILENTLSGVLLLFRQPFRTGDQITVREQTGTVEGITIRETRIRTFDGQLVVIPNRDVYKSVIRVQTHYELRRMSFTVGVAYENDAVLATEVVRQALAEVDGVAMDPPPEALLVELDSSTVDIRAFFWGPPQEYESLLVLDRALGHVKAALDSEGIEMPADIVALQATSSFKAALQGDGDVTPGGGYIPAE